MEKDKERNSENQTFLLEPLLALTGSLTLTQPDTVSGPHKCEIPTQLYLSGKIGIQEAILWLDGPLLNPHFNQVEKYMVTKRDARKGLDLNSIQALGGIHGLDWRQDKRCCKLGDKNVLKWRTYYLHVVYMIVDGVYINWVCILEVRKELIWGISIILILL